jgi:hypothetical protein
MQVYWYLLELSPTHEKRRTKKKFNKERNGERKHIFICIDPLSSCFLLTFFLFEIKKKIEKRTLPVNGVLRRTKRETEKERERE